MKTSMFLDPFMVVSESSSSHNSTLLTSSHKTSQNHYDRVSFVFETRFSWVSVTSNLTVLRNRLQILRRKKIMLEEGCISLCDFRCTFHSDKNNIL